MRFVPFLPRAPLSRYVELVWMLKGTPSYKREKVLPNGAIELIINLGNPHKVVDCQDFTRFQLYRNCWLAGIQESFIIIEALKESDLIGIRFRPGGAYHFLRMSVNDLTNQVVEAEQIFGAFAQELRERLITAATPAARLHIIESMLMQRIGERSPHPLVDQVVAAIRRDPEQSITALSQQTGLSEKHLISLCKRHVGTTPKTLMRILRFQKVINLVSAQSQVDWTEVAHSCGFYDQAHMIREFKLLGGSTPSDYLKYRDEDENHVIVE